MAGIIDIHSHAFPDPIAAAAILALEKEGNIKAYLDGTVSALLSSMDRSGIEQSVLDCHPPGAVRHYPGVVHDHPLGTDRSSPPFATPRRSPVAQTSASHP